MYLSGTDITSREASTYHPLSSNRQLTSKFLFFILYPCNSKMYRLLSCIVHKFYLCQVSLSFNFRMGRSTVCTIIKETCEAVSRVLAKDFVKAPSCALDWEGISREFEKRWNFPNCVGMYVPYTVAILYHTIFISRSD